MKLCMASVDAGIPNQAGEHGSLPLREDLGGNAVLGSELSHDRVDALEVAFLQNRSPINFRSDGNLPSEQVICQQITNYLLRFAQLCIAFGSH